MTTKIFVPSVKARQILVFSLLLAILLFFQCVPTTSKQLQLADVTKPNIVLFYADDLGWMDLAIQGSTYYETPNINRIAKEGMRFTNAYANAANCAPSRACLMTGLYPPRHGIYTVGNAARGKAIHRKLIPVINTTILDTNLLTLPSFLQGKGYQTAIAGKWHLSKDPTPYGFDANFGGFQAGRPKSYFAPYKNPNLSDGPEGEHLTARLATELSNWIKRQNQPFFAYFPFYAVHTPIQARPDLIEKYQNKPPTQYHNKPEYAAMIEAMDLAVGQVLQIVDDLGLTDNTLIIFTADNGAHGGQTLSRPLRGAKGMYYEGGIREPLLIKWPEKIKSNTVNETPVIGSDFFPTIADIVGDTIVQQQLDGRSILPLLQEKPMADRALYWHFPAYLEMYKNDRAFEDSYGKPHFRTTPVSVIRVGDWKLLEYFESGEVELYNLATDIGEQHNIANNNPLRTKELHQQLKAWQTQTGAFIPE